MATISRTAENPATERIWLGVDAPPHQAIGGGSGVVVGLRDGAELLGSDLVHLDRRKIRMLQRVRQHLDEFLKVVAETAYARLDELTPGIDCDRAAQFVEARIDLLERATARTALQRPGRQERNTGLLGKLVDRACRNAHPKRERAALRALLAKHRDAVGEDRPAKRPVLRCPRPNADH